jgi:predicted nucleotidyltransferase
MPTALELSREEWQPYIASLRERRLPPISAGEEHERLQLVTRVREVAAELKRRFGVKRVILFGSVANADWFASDSDVDMAVEGLSPANYWEAWRLAEEIINNRPVDLIDMETAKDSLLRAIYKYGLEL